MLKTQALYKRHSVFYILFYSLKGLFGVVLPVTLTQIPQTLQEVSSESVGWQQVIRAKARERRLSLGFLQLFSKLYHAKYLHNKLSIGSPSSGGWSASKRCHVAVVFFWLLALPRQKSEASLLFFSEADVIFHKTEFCDNLLLRVLAEGHHAFRKTHSISCAI